MNTPFNDFVETSNTPVELPATEVDSYMPFVEDVNITSPLQENELTGTELKKAIDLNKQYMDEYRWRDYGKKILNAMGLTNDDWIRNSWQENLEFFTKYFAEWQEKNGYKTTSPGVFGLNNWTYFQKKIGLNNLSNAYNIDVDKAVSANKRYSSNWNYAKKEIFQYLNNALPLNDEYFAYMIAKFQNDINPEFNNNIKVDGILGSTTWDILRTRIEKANPTFDIKQHIPARDTKAATERYYEELIRYSTLMINALTKIQEDINTYVRNEPIEFQTGKEIIYTIANSVVGAVPLVGATGNALLDLNKEYWQNVQQNIDRQFDKQRSLKLTELIYILKNQLMGQDSKSVIQHNLDDKIKYSGKAGVQLFGDFISEIDRIARLNRSPEEIHKIAFSNLIAAFSHHTRIYVHCQNTTDFRNWSSTDISNLLKDPGRKRLNIRFTNVYPSVTVSENNLLPAAVKNLNTLWELAKTYRYSFKDIKVKKDIFFRVNFPFSINAGIYNSNYSVGLNIYIKTLQPDENWSDVDSIKDLPFNRYWLPNNTLQYKDYLNAVSLPISASNNKGLVYEDMILEIVNSVMANEYDRPATSPNIGLISSETTSTEMDIAAEITDEANEVTTVIEGRTSWAKAVLNNLLAIQLTPDNTIDEATRNAITIFQGRKNLPKTGNIDFVTERALLEADAILRQVPSAASIISSAQTKIEDWTKQGMSGVKTKPQHILNSFRDPRKVWAFVLHQMAFKRRGGAGKQYSAPEGYLNTGSHFCIMLDGRIIQLHPLSRMIWHGNCVSPRSVAVEFEGNFPNVKGGWWYDRSKYKTAPDKDQPTAAQYEAGRFLAGYLKVVLGTTHILAHRQSSDSRENDPGPDIWYNVGEWSMNNLGLTDGGPLFKCGSGNPILPEWRTWGNKTATIANEDYVDSEGEMDWEAYDEATMFNDPGLPGEEETETEDFFFEYP